MSDGHPRTASACVERSPEAIRKRPTAIEESLSVLKDRVGTPPTVARTVASIVQPAIGGIGAAIALGFPIAVEGDMR